MNIIISNSANIPIYEQIYNQIKTLIVSNGLKAGEALPSIRNLAKDLRISVITTKRAYEELERDGYIHSLAGKGSFVAEKNTEIIREAYLKDIEAHIEKISQLSKACNLTSDEVLEMVKLILQEDN